MVDRALIRSPSWEFGTRTGRDSESLPVAGTVRERERPQRREEEGREIQRCPGQFLKTLASLRLLGPLLSYSFVSGSNWFLLLAILIEQMT